MSNKQLKVYGERNTGTNYLTKLISQNLQVEILPSVIPPYVWKVQNMVPGDEFIRDVYFSLSFRANLGWKHSLVNIERLKRNLRSSMEVCFVTVTKNPYTWALSLYRRPYHQHWREKPDFERFLETPWKTVGRENARGDYSHPIALWNQKNESYIKLRQELPTMHFTYEALLANPERSLGLLKDRFSLDAKHEEFTNLDQSTKDSQKTFSDYQVYYLQEKWRECLSYKAIELINAQLDWRVMDYFGYERLN